MSCSVSFVPLLSPSFVGNQDWGRDERMLIVCVVGRDFGVRRAWDDGAWVCRYWSGHVEWVEEFVGECGVDVEIDRREVWCGKSMC